MTQALLTLENLTKSYRGVRALRGINLEVKPNEIFALLGPTGAGKSSTIKATAGLIDLEKGRVIHNGHDISDVHPSNRDFSIVFEGFNLLSVFSVYENIAFALRSPVYREDETIIDQRVKRTAELLRISQLLERKVDKLSGGEKQRVAIARALVRQPSMFLLDEPLSALDLKLREGLRSELRQIHREQNSTMLYATHDYHGAVAFADRIGIIDQGRILQSGTIEEIIERPANTTVGRLIGSPAMAFFEAELQGNEIVVCGCAQRLPASRFELDGGSACEFNLGLWPEDISITNVGSAGSNCGKVYAVDNRGYERAVQIKFGGGAFRKVLNQGQVLHQGDTCGFSFLDGAVHLFNRETGQRISNQKGGTN